MIIEKNIFIYLILFFGFISIICCTFPNFKTIYISKEKYYTINELYIWYIDLTNNAVITHRFTDEQKIKTEKE